MQRTDRTIAVGEPVMRLLVILLNGRLVELTETHDLRSPGWLTFAPRCPADVRS